MLSVALLWKCFWLCMPYQGMHFIYFSLFLEWVVLFSSKLTFMLWEKPIKSIEWVDRCLWFCIRTTYLLEISYHLMLKMLYFLQNCLQWFQSILLQLVVRNWWIIVNLVCKYKVVCSSACEYLLNMGLRAPSSFLKWMAEQNFYNILHAFLQMLTLMLTTSFLHVEYRKLGTYLTTLEYMTWKKCSEIDRK